INLPTWRITNKMVQCNPSNQCRFSVFLWDLQISVPVLTVSILFYGTVDVPEDLVLPVQERKRLSIEIIYRVEHLNKLDNLKRSLLIMSHEHHACSGTAPSEILSSPPAVFSVLP